MAQGYGFGKVILFGEHFVVYGIPAIASGISSKTIAEIEPGKGKGIELVDNRLETPGYKKEKLDQQKDSLNRILEAMKINVKQNPLKITLKGDLIAASGVGASAASCTAIARALSQQFNLNLSDGEINKIAHEGEKSYHGTPSGIDDTASTYGSLLWFKKNLEGGPNTIELIKTKTPIEIVMGNTGIVADTKAAVAGVKERKEKEPEKYDKIFKEAEGLVYNARKSLEDHDLKKVGEYMNDNHRLLQEIGVSCKELDELVELARKQGAFGAKLTGGGLGGYLVALTPGKELQEKVANTIKEKGFSVLKTEIGVK